MVDRIGFTGTRQGMTKQQRIAVGHFLKEHMPLDPTSPRWVIHGSCMGSDEEFHHEAVNLGYNTHLRPTLGPWRAHLTGDIVEPPVDALYRNRLIVTGCDLLVATPEGPETNRSGTWYTIRKAREWQKDRVVIWPDGRVELVTWTGERTSGWKL